MPKPRSFPENAMFTPQITSSAERRYIYAGREGAICGTRYALISAILDISRSTRQYISIRHRMRYQNTAKYANKRSFTLPRAVLPAPDIAALIARRQHLSSACRRHFMAEAPKSAFPFRFTAHRYRKCRPFPRRQVSIWSGRPRLQMKI